MTKFANTNYIFSSFRLRRQEETRSKKRDQSFQHPGSAAMGFLPISCPNHALTFSLRSLLFLVNPRVLPWVFKMFLKMTTYKNILHISLYSKYFNHMGKLYLYFLWIQKYKDNIVYKIDYILVYIWKITYNFLTALVRVYHVHFLHVCNAN